MGTMPLKRLAGGEAPFGTRPVVESTAGRHPPEAFHSTNPAARTARTSSDTEKSMNNDGVSVAFQIILDEIAAVVEEVNAQGAAFMMNSDYPKAQAAITSGRKLSSFGEKLESLRQEWIAGLDEPTRAQVRIEPASVAHSIASAPKSPKTVLVVKFPDGTVIYEATAAATYVKTLKKLGLSRVGGLGIQINNHPLVSKERSSTYTQTEIDGYLVMTHSNTENKRKQLENIAAQLKVELAVDVVPAKDG